MIVFKGNKRLFDKIIDEDNTSTLSEHIISIYGVTSYVDISNTILNIVAFSAGSANATININNLGNIPIKEFNQEGQLIFVKDNWILEGQIYTIMYRNGNFILLSNNLNNLDNTYKIPEEILTLTSSSTSADIETAFDNNESEFIENIVNKKDIIILGENLKINVNYSIKEIDTTTIEITLEFIHNGNYYKQVYSINSVTEVITGVIVETVDLLSLNTNNINS